MSYFLVFLTVFSGFAFFGRPTGLGLFNCSTTAGSYIFVRPTLRTGFILSKAIRLFIVWKGSFNISAISRTVSSSIFFISSILIKNLSDVNEILHFCIDKIIKKIINISTFSLKILDYLSDMGYIFNIRQKQKALNT